MLINKESDIWWFNASSTNQSPWQLSELHLLMKTMRCGLKLQKRLDFEVGLFFSSTIKDSVIRFIFMIQLIHCVVLLLHQTTSLWHRVTSSNSDCDHTVFQTQPASCMGRGGAPIDCFFKGIFMSWRAGWSRSGRSGSLGDRSADVRPAAREEWATDGADAWFSPAGNGSNQRL